MLPVRLGIKIKMTLAFSAVFIVLALIFNFNSYRHIRGLLIEDNDQYLLARANSLLGKTEVNPPIISLPDKGDFIRVFYHVNGRPQVVFESPGLPGGISIPPHTGISDTLGMRIAFVRHNGNNADDNPAELLLVTSANPLNARIHSLINRLFISSLLSVLIAGCVSYLLAGVLLRPLKRIIYTAATIRHTRMGELIPVRQTRDELQDLTETLNAMLTRIGEGLRQQQSFFASASHELKTPLAVLRAEIELNLNQPDIRQEMRGFLQSQLQEIKRLQERVDEFLLVSQLKEGSLVLRKTKFDLSECIIRSFNQLMILLAAKQLTPSVYFDPEADGFNMEGDEDKISIVVLNLLENAIKYSVPGTTITCRVERSVDAKTLILTMDNKTSVREIDTTKLQDAFYRADQFQAGTGLGLWLCGEIIRLHEGLLSFRSEDHRFTVVMTLPERCCC